MKQLTLALAIGICSLAMTACATLKPQAQSVKIVDPAEVSKLESCKEIGPVTESSEGGHNQLVTLLKNKTADHGGNVLVSKMRTEKTMGFFRAADETQGVVYSCSEQVVASLHNAENF